jgi:RNA polymerase sigma factor (TIGR02999 family)
MDDPHEVTRLLEQLSAGEPGAAERLAPAVYAELRALAQAAMRRERDGHTWQPTELVHEAYMRLVGTPQPAWAGRRHFFGVAARVMRRLLVEHARARGRTKRDGGLRVPLDDAFPAAGVPPLDLVALDDALTRLAAVGERQARVVELRVFGGMTLEETADVLDVSLATAKRDWTFARAFLRLALDGEGGGR